MFEIRVEMVGINFVIVTADSEEKVNGMLPAVQKKYNGCKVEVVYNG